MESGEAERLSILIVDDEPAIRDVFSRFLSRRGHEVTTCGTAREGLDLAVGPESAFDVVVTDLLLPDMTGIELARSLRGSGCRAQLIMLTGEPNSETADVARELQVYKYLAKPIRAGALIDIVEEAGRISRH